MKISHYLYIHDLHKLAILLLQREGAHYKSYIFIRTHYASSSHLAWLVRRSGWQTLTHKSGLGLALGTVVGKVPTLSLHTYTVRSQKF